MFTITRPGQELSPIELGKLHAWVMKIQAKIERAYVGIDLLDISDLDLDNKLAMIQYELDDVVWLIDEESWAAFNDQPLNQGFL